LLVLLALLVLPVLPVLLLVVVLVVVMVLLVAAATLIATAHTAGACMLLCGASGVLQAAMRIAMHSGRLAASCCMRAWCVHAVPSSWCV
jgi:hypothetical protein